VIVVHQPPPADRSPVVICTQPPLQHAVAVGVHLAGYHLPGTVRLPGRVAWEQYLRALRDRFLVLGNATITRAVDEQPVAAVGYVAVNREHLGVLYET